MKREIKFRSWHIPNREMFTVYGWNEQCVFKDGDDGIGVGDYNPAKNEDCILLQYSGLKDIYGTEVYEGDIITYTLMNDDETGTIEYTEEVSFVDGCFVLDGITPLYIINDSNISKVVGNIYENQSILK